MNTLAPDVEIHWTAIRPLLTVNNEKDYDLAVERLNRLLDEVGTNQRHPLYTLLDTLGTVLRAYEEDHHPVPSCSGAEVLRFLMEEHALTQSGLPKSVLRASFRKSSTTSAS